MELYYCGMLITLSKIRLDFNPIEPIKLINAIIEGTPHQQRLIEWKKKNGQHQSKYNTGKIIEKYFFQFMKQNAHRLVSKRGRKYEIYRATWNKHQNFKQIYDCIEDALIKSGLAKALDVPIFMDKDGNKVS